MNKKWKNQVMISFSILKKILMNRFMSWNLWIKNVLRDEVVEKYNTLIDNDNSLAKTNLFASLYDASSC